jgi:hypothetical protein
MLIDEAREALGASHEASLEEEREETLSYSFTVDADDLQYDSPESYRDRAAAMLDEIERRFERYHDHARERERAHRMGQAAVEAAEAGDYEKARELAASAAGEDRNYHAFHVAVEALVEAAEEDARDVGDEE